MIALVGYPAIALLGRTLRWTVERLVPTQVPKPFSRVAVALGPPIAVPDTHEHTIEIERRELESSLMTLEATATDMLRR